MAAMPTIKDTKIGCKTQIPWLAAIMPVAKGQRALPQLPRQQKKLIAPRWYRFGNRRVAMLMAFGKNG